MPFLFTPQPHPVEACARKPDGHWYTVRLVTYVRDPDGTIVASQLRAVARFLSYDEAGHYARARAKYGLDCEAVVIT